MYLSNAPFFLVIPGADQTRSQYLHRYTDKLIKTHAYFDPTLLIRDILQLKKKKDWLT